MPFDTFFFLCYWHKLSFEIFLLLKESPTDPEVAGNAPIVLPTGSKLKQSICSSDIETL